MNKTPKHAHKATHTNHHLKVAFGIHRFRKGKIITIADAMLRAMSTTSGNWSARPPTKTATWTISGTYHHVSKQHLHRYLSEFDFRFNAREMSDSDRREAALKGFGGKRLMLKDPIGKTEKPS